MFSAGYAGYSHLRQTQTPLNEAVKRAVTKKTEESVEKDEDYIYTRWFNEDEEGAPQPKDLNHSTHWKLFRLTKSPDPGIRDVGVHSLARYPLHGRHFHSLPLIYESFTCTYLSML